MLGVVGEPQGTKPGKTKTGLILSFSRTRRSASMRCVRARGRPPVAARRGSLGEGGIEATEEVEVEGGWAWTEAGLLAATREWR